ncbi:MAG: methyltransferase domain-containing protein [Armatimonadetes bacterium]|nr:methyltransferase domain-containing protein [Armatimonadota bacterium]
MSTLYDARSITVLKGLDAVRRRPSMYIGSTGPDGLHNMVVEIVQNAIDEVLAGSCTRIDVTLHADGSCSVEDDGRGIPVDVHPDDGRPACEVVLTELHSGGKFAETVYTAPGGLHGVGLAAVNALSTWLMLDIWRDGTHFQQEFTRGVPSPLLRLEDSGRRGTRVRFHPDPAIFCADGDPEKPYRINDANLRGHLQAQAFLQAGLRIGYLHEVTGHTETHQYDSGISGFVSWLNRARQPVHPAPIDLEGKDDGVDVHVALQWTHKYSEDLRAFVNRIYTPQGGTHLEGLKAALTHVVNEIAEERAAGEVLAGYDVREGLTAVLSVRLRNPEFEGQTKASLTSARAEGAVQRVVAAQLTAWLAKTPEVASALVGRALEASRARAASRRASERARYQRRDMEISREVYREQFGIRSSNWHESARWITDRPLLDLHAAATGVPPTARVLDACCGSGVVGDSFRGRVAHITGLDITPEMVKIARTRLDEVVQGDVYHIPFEDNHFDLVCNREVLHLLVNPEKPVSEIFRVLRPGGQFVVGQLLPYGAADAAWMFRLLKKKQPLFFNNFLDTDFREMLESVGFVNVTMTEITQWEDIDTWIDTWETSSIHRHEIRDLYHHAPAEVRAAHPFRILPSGAIEDCWRWCVFSAFKPENLTAGEK